MEESFAAKMAKAQTREERADLKEQEPTIKAKIARIKECTRAITYHKDFLSTEEQWNERFDLPRALFLEQVADTNMRIFLGMTKEEDLQLS